MAKFGKAVSKPKMAVQYILDVRKLEAVEGLREFVERVRATVRGMGWELKEFGPESDPDAIRANARSCRGQYAGFLGVTFTGTSARQTAVIGQFEGPVGVWYFPETPWWSMASAASGIGYLRDEAEEKQGMHVSVVWGDPDDRAAKDRLECFARSAHTVFALKRDKIGLIGGAYYDVMPASNWHPDIMSSRLGPSYVEIDMSLLVREMKNVGKADIDGLIEELKKTGMRVATDAASMKKIRQSAQTSLAIERLQKEYKLTGVAVNCYGGADPEGYTGVLGYCGASGCLKAHALCSVTMGCESDVIQCAQQMLFRHLVGVTPCMADPWKVTANGVLLAGTCGGPAELAGDPKRVSIEAGTLMSLYKVGVLGVSFPDIPTGDAIVARIAGRQLDRMVVTTGKFLGSDSVTMPGRLCLHVKLDEPEEFLEYGTVGNHFTFLPTKQFDRDMTRLETVCDMMGIEIDKC